MSLFFAPKCFHNYKEIREDKEKVKHKENFLKMPFLDIYLKHIHLSMHGHLVHIWFTPNYGPKDFKSTFLKIKPWKCDHEKNAL